MTEKPIVVYTDHIMNRTLCYNFAKGSDSLLCHVKNFNDCQPNSADSKHEHGIYYTHQS